MKTLHTKDTAPGKFIWRVFSDSIYGPQLKEATTRSEQAAIIWRARTELKRLRKKTKRTADPGRKGYKPKSKEETTCLKCRKTFMSPDKARIRICRICKSKRPLKIYEQPITKAPDA